MLSLCQPLYANFLSPINNYQLVKSDCSSSFNFMIQDNNALWSNKALILSINSMHCTPRKSLFQGSVVYCTQAPATRSDGDKQPSQQVISMENMILAPKQ